VVEGCRDDGVGVGARTTAQAPLPEICQKLRYTHPHAAPRSHSWKRLPTCAIVWRRGVLHSVVNHRRIDGKDGVAGSIPAGGSTTNPQLRPGATPGLSRDQEPATAFAREFARLSCTF
jgi:hypothetical protein